MQQQKNYWFFFFFLVLYFVAGGGGRKGTITIINTRRRSYGHNFALLGVSVSKYFLSRRRHHHHHGHHHKHNHDTCLCGMATHHFVELAAWCYPTGRTGQSLVCVRGLFGPSFHPQGSCPTHHEQKSALLLNTSQKSNGWPAGSPWSSRLCK